VPQVVLAAEHYNRLIRMIQAGEKLRMKVSLKTQFTNDDPMAYNTIAEIPGSDKADEVVMVGGHIDSWHSGTGATDNGAGVAAAMEAVRILQALQLKPRRTIRIGLWSGEEQALFGSQAYVAQHFGKPNDSQDANFLRMIEGGTAQKFIRGPEYDKLSAYYNLDNGTGKIRGIYLQGNEALRASLGMGARAASRSAPAQLALCLPYRLQYCGQRLRCSVPRRRFGSATW